MASRLTSLRGVALSRASSCTASFRVASHQRIAARPLVNGQVRYLSEQKDAQIKSAMAKAVDDKLPAWREFHTRHIGPRDSDIEQMLKTVGMKPDEMQDFLSQVIPKDVFDAPTRSTAVVENKTTEETLKPIFMEIAKKNGNKTWMNGRGFYPVHVPAVIKRNLFENPAWYTSYTPYQAEISQGRLESLLNYQTMVSDLTGLPVANASLLDEGTAGAEAMTMSLNCLSSSRQKRPNKTYVVSHRVEENTINILHQRAEGFGIKIQVEDFSKPEIFETLKGLNQDLVGAMVQYPDNHGDVCDFRKVSDAVHELGCQMSAATDLSALTVLTPPGEWGADIAFGNSQRFGVPLGCGGPHAAFFATRENNKRRLPGRIVGMTKDRLGRPALRLALQTREQHIRREKATSNVCTAQALLANMAAMFAVYHGPEQLREMALENLRGARLIQDTARGFGFKVAGSSFDPAGATLSDTVVIEMPNQATLKQILADLDSKDISASVTKEGNLLMSVSNNLTPSLYRSISECLQANAQQNKLSPDALLEQSGKLFEQSYAQSFAEIFATVPETVRRSSEYLTHPVFNSHHSETEMLRYLHHLQSRDLSQVHSMIPLGSCTMKLNGTSQLELIGIAEHSNVHPHAPAELTEGHTELVNQLRMQLTNLTGMDDTSIQPNSGAQGEFAGLRVISQFHQKNGSTKRDICLIPVSAHGTNPASAAMAGMRTVPIKCDATTGNLDMADLKAKCAKHADELAAIMITYPSTYGVFEPQVREAINTVHEHGGQVYMDGANMNAQIGLTSPGALGADVCHLNLHKTFCIPHGGGGPGVGPIAVKQHLAPFLPDHESWVTTSRYGSASILPISWAYMQLMRDDGLVKATKVALLNANYLLARLKDHYPIVYTNSSGRCAHEFIIDARPFKASAGVEVADIAKRLQDYGFHAPTMSFPIPGTLMIEPTESESKEELDRFADAMIQIRAEIKQVEDGKQPRTGNVLTNAPHPQLDIVRGDGEGQWNRPYSRETAAYPLPYLVEKKFWPTVGRADDTYGDTNLFCTCPPVEDTTQQD